jgi:hypothetical protein
MDPLLTPRRLRHYPRLIGAALWAAWGLELLLHRGWLSGLGPVLWSDVVVFYGAGWLDRYHPEQLYDFQAQRLAEQNLIWPTPLPGLNPFTYPPYVALACQALTLFPYPIALALWMGLNLFLALHASRRLWRLLPPALRSGPLPFPQFLVLVFSFFPFLVGWRVGQNHVLTLWLVVGILEMERAKRPFLAGVLAGLLLYKPHFALGFLILWAVRREWRALAGFGAVAGVWVGLDLALHGLARYGEYLVLNPTLMGLPKMEGFPAFALVTPFSLLINLLPAASRPLWAPLSGVWLLAGCLALAVWGLRHRGEMTSAQMLALLFPLLIAPYTLLHDLLLLVPLAVLWATFRPSRCLLYTAVSVYLGSLFLPLLGTPLRLALPALIPVGVLFALIRCGVLRGDERGFPSHKDAKTQRVV